MEEMKLEDFIKDFVRVSEKAALSCYPFIGKGDGKGADREAVKAMREAFSQLPMDIQIVIGEGERDKAPRLFTGERLGQENSDFKVDVAVDPLEGTNLCAHNKPGAFSVFAVSKRGGLFKAPDIYMEKLAVKLKSKNKVSLKNSVLENLNIVAKAEGKKREDLRVGVLNRKRHEKLIEEIKKAGASLKLIEDGDVALSIEVASKDTLDVLMGSGGAPEGVLSAVALKNLGAYFEGQLLFHTEEEKQRARLVGVKDLDQILNQDELSSSEALFFATGVTSGELLEGVKKAGELLETESMILGSSFRKKIKASHNLRDLS